MGKAQPLDEPVMTPFGPMPMGSIGPGDLVHFIDGREAALALPDETFVPVDATITGYVEQVHALGRDISEAPESEGGPR